MFRRFVLVAALLFCSVVVSAEEKKSGEPMAAPPDDFGTCLVKRVECEMKGFKSLEDNPQIASAMSDPDCFVLRTCFVRFMECLNSIPKPEKKVGA